MRVIAPPGFLNPMTAAGDIIQGGASGIPTRLGAGTAGQALLSNGPGAALAWGTAGFVSPITTQGDLIQGGVAGAPVRLAASATAGQALLSNGSGAALSWGAAGFTNPMTTAGDIIQGGAAGVPVRLAASGTAGQALVSNGTGVALSWGSNGLVNPMTTTGDLIIGGAAGAPARLAASATGGQALLTVGAGATPVYGSPLSAQWVFFQPTAALYETCSRVIGGGGGSANIATGVLRLSMIYLPSGLTIGHLAFVSGATASETPVNWWFGLYDNAFNQLATTADQGAGAWGTNTIKSLAVAQIASGASATFTTTYSGLHYLGFMMKTSAGTFTLLGLANLTNGNPNNVAALTPFVSGASDTVQTTPPAFPHVATTPTSGLGSFDYGYVAA